MESVVADSSNTVYQARSFLSYPEFPDNWFRHKLTLCKYVHFLIEAPFSWRISKQKRPIAFSDKAIWPSLMFALY